MVCLVVAASVEVLSQSALTTPEIPVLEEKAVFPHDESDFEMIRQHNGTLYGIDHTTHQALEPSYS